MATGLCDAGKPRRYDLTMSRRTRRPAAATANVVTDCSQDQGMEAESQMMMIYQQQHQNQVKVTQLKELFQCPCDTYQMQSQQPEDTQEHKALQQTEDAGEQTLRQKSLEEEEAQHDQHQQWLQCEDNSRRLSLQELIDDEPIDGAKDAATRSQEDSSATAAVQGAAEAAAAAKQPEHVAGKKKMIGMMRRYVRVRSIKPKPAPERNVAPPIC